MEHDKHDICYYSEHISWVCLAEEVFVFDEITKKIYILKGIQKEFWLLIDGKKSIDHLIIEMHNKTCLSVGEIMKSLNAFFQKMNNKKLINWVMDDEGRNTN